MGIKADFLKKTCQQLGINYVGQRGCAQSPVAIVGEAPGENEDEQGLPFVGFSGQELERMIDDAGLSSQDVWFTNPFKIRPPENDLDRIEERGIPKDIFIEQFFEEMEETKPTIIIAAGATPLSILCPHTLTKSKNSKEPPTSKIGLWRGSLLTCSRFKWPHYVIPMYHPAFILREWSERQLAVLCLARAKEEMDYWKQNGKMQPLPERELIVVPPYDTAMEYMREVLNSNEPVSVDIEMIRSKYPYTISLAKSPKSAISISLWEYDIEQCCKIWMLLDEILRTKVQIGQNYLGFDCCWMEWLGFRPTPQLTHDVLIRHHILWPEFSHKLESTTFQYTREPYYKQEGHSWKVKDGLRPLMIYNCKDTAVTYEIFLEQEKEFDDRPYLREFYENYQRKLAHAFHGIDKRGILTDSSKMGKLREYIKKELEKSCTEVESTVHLPVVSSKEEGERKNLKDYFNVGSGQQVIKVLQSLGLKVPKNRFTGKESSGEENLNNLFAETGNPILKGILRIRELNKILGTYVNAKLANDVMYCEYVVTGTVSGRRSSRANFLKLGTNHQNQPKHSDLGKQFRSCIISRPGKIFVHCDQHLAEDWLVQGIIADVSGDRRGFEELSSGIDRHCKLASFLFSKPETECGKDTPERFFGKKTRHAGNYDMGPEEMSRQLAREGHIIPASTCEWFLLKFHQADPGIRGVYHAYVQERLIKTRTLRTPFNRERVFFGLRPFADNKKIFKEAYSYIPQSTVGDNTGMAILYLEEVLKRQLLALNPSIACVVMDEHDAVLLEVDDNVPSICNAIISLSEAFDRPITLQNGLTFTIPIEVEIGYNAENLIKCPVLSLATGLEATVIGLKSRLKAQVSTIDGLLQQSSQQVSSVMSG